MRCIANVHHVAPIRITSEVDVSNQSHPPRTVDAPASQSPSPSPWIAHQLGDDHGPAGADRALAALATRLAFGEPPPAHGPELIILHGPASEGGGTIETRALEGSDPVADLIGLAAEPTWVGVGVRAPATGRRIAIGSEEPCTLVHLLDRRGVSVTDLWIGGDERIELGPDRAVREGRIPDACRRMFALPTADPPADMSGFVLDAWLAIVLRAALLDPGLRWPEIVRLSLMHHLGAITDPAMAPNPAALAMALRDTATTLDWHRYRSACVMLGGCPVSELTAPQIEWMDTGMFARWTQGSLPCTADLLDLLEPVLHPIAFDHLWAAVSLTRRDGDGPDR